MPKFVIERDFPGAGTLTPGQLREISLQSCRVLKRLGSEIQWIESYVADERIFCIYIAPDEALLRKHAEIGGFPVTRISVVRSMIDPATAE